VSGSGQGGREGEMERRATIGIPIVRDARRPSHERDQYRSPSRAAVQAVQGQSPPHDI
jgi:hypothetical protein